MREESCPGEAFKAKPLENPVRGGDGRYAGVDKGAAAKLTKFGCICEKIQMYKLTNKYTNTNIHTGVYQASH